MEVIILFAHIFIILLILFFHYRNYIYKKMKIREQHKNIQALPCSKRLAQKPLLVNKLDTSVNEYYL